MAEPGASMSRRSVLGGGVALLTTGCLGGARLHTFPFDGSVEALAGDPDDLVVTFFSVACFVVRWRGLAFVLDPYFTHLPFGLVASGRVEPDPAAVQEALPTVRGAQAVLIGHAHYDHCLGLAPIVPHLDPSAVLVGSATAAHTFAPLALPRPWVVVNDRAASPEAPGRWIEAAGGRLRILPIRSGHPDNVPGIHVFQQRLSEDRARPPTQAAHFQEGDTFAYLVDFLEEDGTIAHRVLAETSSTGPPAGIAPSSVFDAHPVDVGLLAMDTANFRRRGQPSVLDHVDPRHVVFCHWGNFFRAKDKVPREGVKVDLPRTRETLRAEPGGERYLFPGWHTHFRFSRS